MAQGHVSASEGQGLNPLSCCLTGSPHAPTNQAPKIVPTWSHVHSSIPEMVSAFHQVLEATQGARGTPSATHSPGLPELLLDLQVVMIAVAKGKDGKGESSVSLCVRVGVCAHVWVSVHE